MPLSFGIIPQIGESNEENEISKICTFRALQIWYQSQALIFLMGYEVWSLDIGGEKGY